MPSRYIRAEILTSRVQTVSMQAECLYFHILLSVDDFGRMEYDSESFASIVFPRRRALRDHDISRWLSELSAESAGAVLVYQCAEKQYIAVRRVETPRAIKSKCPEPPDGYLCWRIQNGKCVESTTSDKTHTSVCKCTGLHTNVPLNVPVPDTVPDLSSANAEHATTVAKAPVRSRRRKEYRIKFNGVSFEGIVDTDWATWAEAFPAVDCRTESLKAALWLKTNPEKRKLDNERFLVRWFTKAQERGGDRPARRATAMTHMDGTPKDYSGELK